MLLPVPLSAWFSPWKLWGSSSSATMSRGCDLRCSCHQPVTSSATDSAGGKPWTGLSSASAKSAPESFTHSPDRCNWVVDVTPAINLTPKQWEIWTLWPCATATLLDYIWKLTLHLWQGGNNPSILKYGGKKTYSSFRVYLQGWLELKFCLLCEDSNSI